MKKIDALPSRARAAVLRSPLSGRRGGALVRRHSAGQVARPGDDLKFLEYDAVVVTPAGTISIRLSYAAEPEVQPKYDPERGTRWKWALDDAL